MTVCLRVFMCVSADGSCDASEAPEHGDVGDCPQQIQSNSTCQPTCDTGYVVSGVSRCENGVLIAANCTRSNSTSAWTSSTSSSPSLLFNSTGVASGCNASVAPENGDVGNCTAFLANGAQCQPTCDSGYTVSGSSTCADGVLTAATCEGKAFSQRE